MSGKLIVSIAATLLSWTCAGCTVHCFLHFFRDPANFGEAKFLGFGKPKLASLYVLFVWIGIGYCILSGVETTLQWIPRSWVDYGDDPDDTPIWIGHILAIIVAFVGSGMFIDQMGKVAQRLKDCEQNHAESFGSR